MGMALPVDGEEGLDEGALGLTDVEGGNALDLEVAVDKDDDALPP